MSRRELLAYRTRREQLPWNPLSLGPLCHALYDAADRGSISLDGSGKVSSWRDRTRRCPALPPTANAPGYSGTGLGTAGAIVFPVARNAGLRKLSAAEFNLGRPLGLFALVKFDGSGANDAVVTIGAQATLPSYTDLLRDSSSRITTYDNSARKVGPVLASGIYLLASWHTSATINNLRSNGATQSIDADGGSIAISDGQLSVGINYAASGSWMYGKIGCVVLLNGAPTTDQLQRLEGWAAHKWGVQSILPASHPYKNSAP